MNFGAMSVSRSVNAVSAIPAVNSNRDIIYFPGNSRVMFHEKNIEHYFDHNHNVLYIYTV